MSYFATYNDLNVSEYLDSINDQTTMLLELAAEHTHPAVLSSPQDTDFTSLLEKADDLQHCRIDICLDKYIEIE